MTGADAPDATMAWPGIIRAGRLDDLEQLAAIEIDAAHALVEAGAIPPNDLSATPRGLMEQCVREGLLFVATGESDAPLGFAAAALKGSALYIGEIDVWRRWQGHGIGRSLMLAALAEARQRGLQAAMLTTDRLAPFNRAFYESLGFREIGDAHLPRSLAEILRAEIELGLDPARRLGMLLPLDCSRSEGGGQCRPLP